MKNERDLYGKYGDVLGDTADPEMVHLVGCLDALSTEEAPSARTVGAIWGRLNERNLRPRGRRTIRAMFAVTGWIPHRMSTVAAGLLAFFVLAGAGYSVLPVVEQALNLDQKTAPIAEQHLGKEVNQSRTVGGFTVTVTRVYADADQVVVAYAVRGPDGRNFNSLMAWGQLEESGRGQLGTLPMLTDASGSRLGAVGNVSGNGVGGIYGTGVQGGESGQALRYRTPSTHQEELPLHFEVAKITAYEQLGEDQYQALTVTGPFRFDFTVPVEHR